MLLLPFVQFFLETTHFPFYARVVPTHCTCTVGWKIFTGKKIPHLLSWTKLTAQRILNGEQLEHAHKHTVLYVWEDHIKLASYTGFHLKHIYKNMYITNSSLQPYRTQAFTSHA